MQQTSYRTLTCADARLDAVGQPATLAGWVNRRRDLGQLIFLDLRDRYGITQVVIDNADAPTAHAIAESVRSEFVVRVSGTITGRLVNLGDQVTVGQHLFDLVDFDSIVARIYVPEKDLPRLKVGQTAWVTSQSGDESTRGEVNRISPIVDSSPD